MIIHRTSQKTVFQEKTDMNNNWAVLDQLENEYLDGDIDDSEYERRLRRISARQTSSV
jgi:uncharacterized membrane protein